MHVVIAADLVVAVAAPVDGTIAIVCNTVDDVTVASHSSF